MWRWISGGVFIALLLSASFVEAEENPFLSRHQTSFTDLTAFTKWTSLMPRYEAEKMQANRECASPGGACPSEAWEALIDSLRGAPKREQMDAVNRFFNRVPYVEDIKNYGMDDYWQTPYEFMQRGGDCEDYAIAKYITLKRLGFREEDMRILIVQDSNLNGIMHAVLEVNNRHAAYILDNQAQQVIAAARIFHYQPIYALNELVWWAFS